MFKISGVKTRYFEFEAPDNQKVLLLEPPKLKTLKDMEDLQTSNDSAVSDIAVVLSKILSKNKSGRKISPDTVMTWMDIDQMQAFLVEFMSWIKNERTSDPN